MVGRHGLEDGSFLHAVLISLDHLGHRCVSYLLGNLKLLELAAKVLGRRRVAHVFDFVDCQVAVARETRRHGLTFRWTERELGHSLIGGRGEVTVGDNRVGLRMLALVLSEDVQLCPSILLQLLGLFSLSLRLAAVHCAPTDRAYAQRLVLWEREAIVVDGDRR